MLMVVSSHAIEWTESAVVSEFSSWVHIFSGSAQLPVFFCVSGILFAGSSNSRWTDLWRRRVLPLLWVFVIWQPVVFAYKFAAGQFLPNQEDPSLMAHLARLIASPVRPSGELWFLWALALFILIKHATRGAPVALQLALAGAVSGTWLSAAPNILGSNAVRLLGPGLNGIVSYYFFFLIGVLFAAQWRQSADLSRRKLALVVLGWVAFVIASKLTILGEIAGLPFALRVVGLLGCMSAAVVLVRSRLLQVIGRASINLYLVHTTVIVGVLIALRGVAPIPWGWLGPVLLVAGAVAVGLLFYRLNLAGHLTWLTNAPRRRSADTTSG